MKKEKKSKEEIDAMKKNQKPTIYHHAYILDKDQEIKRMTICGIIYEDSHKVLFMRIGMAICSNKDCFSKLKGRVISRLKAHQKTNDVIQVNSYSDSRKEIIKWINSRYETFSKKWNSEEKINIFVPEYQEEKID
jgi:hypothetical protein